MRAQALYQQATAQLLAMDRDSAFSLAIASIEAWPGHLEANLLAYELMRERGDRRLIPELRARLPVADSATSACLAALAHLPVGDVVPTYELLRGMEADLGQTECSASSIAMWMPGREPNSLVLEYVDRALLRFPGQDRLHIARAETLARMGNYVDAIEAVRAREGRTDPIERFRANARIVRFQMSSGDTVGARATARAMTNAVMRDRAPGLMFEYAMWAGGSPVAERGVTTVSGMAALRMAARLAQEHSSSTLESIALEHATRTALDTGEPAAALDISARLVALADSADNLEKRLTARMLRGRVLTNMGMLDGARAVLLEADSVSQSRNALSTTRADIQHSLAHFYESTGELPLAAVKVRAFVELARAERFSGTHIISLHDAATIYRKLGWNAAARSVSAELVAVVDSTRGFRYWAGEYHENAGNARTALNYYRAGLNDPGTNDSQDRRRLFAGAARIYNRLGMGDSAQIYARLHDSELARSDPLTIPLEPTVLAASGSTDAAATLARDWARRRSDAGNIAGSALALAQEAQILLDGGRFRQAAAEARRSSLAAARMHMADAGANATRVEGEATLAMGDADSALSILTHRLPKSVQALHDTTLLGIHVARGKMLASLERADEALAEFDAAAAIVERDVARFADDVDRVRFRDLNAEPYENAIETILDHYGADSAVPLIVAWSARRKAAALRLVTGETEVGAIDTDLLSEILDATGPNDVVLDYTILDSELVVAVVAGHSARIVRLVANVDSIQNLVVRLREPLVATHARMIDLARATFSLTVAHELYKGLLEPVLDDSNAPRRVTIVPDAWLFHVPFEALVRRLPSDHNQADYSNAGFVVDDVEVEYALSINRRSAPGIARDASREVLMVTGETPGLRAEVSAVTAVWGERASVLQPHEATETRVRDAWGAYEVLHVASHASADDTDPLGSHLLLRADRVNDGFVHISEIVGSRPTPPLLILSACETITGPVYNGEGIMGLARAFLAGGAARVVASRWPVAAQTSILMGFLHRKIADGASPARSLRFAQLALRNEPETSHPFYWAGFSVFGY